jgi:hypothetical protein
LQLPVPAIGNGTAVTPIAGGRNSPSNARPAGSTAMHVPRTREPGGVERRLERCAIDQSCFDVDARHRGGVVSSSASSYASPMTARELTDPAHSTLPDSPATWRGRDFELEVLPLLEDLRTGAGNDVLDSQPCFVGYVPGADEFIIAFDLWLNERDPSDADPDARKMACSVVRARFVLDHGRLEVRPSRHVRVAFPFYRDPIRQLRADHADLVELILD